MRSFSVLLLFTFLFQTTSAFVASSGPRGARRSTNLMAAAKKGAAKKKAAKKKVAKKKAPTAEVIITKRKNDIIASVAEKTEMTKIQCETCMAAVLDTIVEEVSAGNKVNIAGFGTFKRSDRKERKGRNPKTGEELLIKAKKAPSFSAGKQFKERVNK